MIKVAPENLWTHLWSFWLFGSTRYLNPCSEVFLQHCTKYSWKVWYFSNLLSFSLIIIPVFFCVTLKVTKIYWFGRSLAWILFYYLCSLGALPWVVVENFLRSFNQYPCSLVSCWLVHWQCYCYQQQLYKW